MVFDTTAWAIPVAAALRSIAGWLENSLRDGKIEKYEWGQLGATILRVGAIGLALYFGFNLDGLESGGIAIAVDFVLSAVKKIKG